MNIKEQNTLKDEIRIWKEALADEKQGGNKDRIRRCEGALQALRGLALEYGIEVEK